MINEYSENANKTINYEISEEERMLQASIGMTGESAEVMDLIKKVHFQKHTLNEEKIDKIIEEMGDILWYMNLMIKTINTTWDNVLITNNEKLAKRYPKGEFNSLDSMNRK